MANSFGATFIDGEALGAAALNAAVNGGVGVTLTATGTDQGSALAIPLTQQVSIFTTVAAGTGAILPNFASSQVGYFGDVVNAGSNNLHLYPFGSGTIDGGSAGAASLIPPGAAVRVYVNAPGVFFLR